MMSWFDKNRWYLESLKYDFQLTQSTSGESFYVLVFGHYLQRDLKWDYKKIYFGRVFTQPGNEFRMTIPGLTIFNRIDDCNYNKETIALAITQSLFDFSRESIPEQFSDVYFKLPSHLIERGFISDLLDSVNKFYATINIMSS